MQKDWKEALSQLASDEKNSEMIVPDNQQNENIKNHSVKKQHLEIAIDKKGRNGKYATIIYGYNGNEQKLNDFAKELKKELGIGGSTRDGEILLQGDQREKLIKILTDKGHQVKRRN